MSAPSIPHLSSLLTRGGGPRSRGTRGRARGGGGSSSEPDDPAARAAAHDRTIQGTDGDAASSRASAVALGYLRDPYAVFFSPDPPPRRYPLINRGTYVRTTALDRLIGLFLSAPTPGTKKQIVSLGAGSDTRFFRLAAPDLVYHELDFAAVTVAKINRILSVPALKACLPSSSSSSSSSLSVSPERDSLSSATLNIHALDLRTLPSLATLPNLDPALPTLVLSECCLTYLPLARADAVVSHVLTALLRPTTPAALLAYEPLHPADAFGHTMAANLASRGIAMPSLAALPTIEAHRRRMRRLGLESTGGRSVRDIYASAAGGEAWVAPEERARVERLEWLDEVEEWNLLAGHYCVVWGSREGEGKAKGVFGRAWEGVAGQWRENEREMDDLHAADA